MTKHQPNSGLLFLVIVFSFSSSLSQSQTSGQQHLPAPKFTSKTELVLVPAVVTDKWGEHVAGLTQGDFLVLENGKQQQISVFEELRTTNKPLPAKATAEPNEFSNYGVLNRDSNNRRLTIIAFDAINTPVVRQAVLRRQLLARLAQAATASEPTALYSIGLSGVRTVVDFTADPRVVAEALSRLKYSVPLAEERSLEGLPHETAKIDMQAEEDALNEQGRSAIVHDQNSGHSALVLQLEVFQRQLAKAMTSQERYLGAVYLLTGLQQIAQACAGIPGRKSLIWVTGGFPLEISMQPKGNPASNLMNWGDVRPAYERTMQALNDAQIAVYPLDVGGIDNPSLVSPSMQHPTGTYQQQVSWESAQSANTLNTFAGATGGKVYRNSNDLAAGFDEAIKDSASYYLLGYYIHPEKLSKTTWQNIAVKVKKSGTQVRARDGYFLSPSTAPADSRQKDLASALTSPLDFTAVGITVRWKGTSALQGDERRIAYDVLVRPDLTVDESDGNHLLLDIVSATRTIDGSLAGTPAMHALEGRLDAARLARYRADGWTYSGLLELGPGDYNVRFVVRDGLSGRMGSVDAHLKVAP